VGLNAEWQARKAAATPRGVGVLESFYAARAENAELWDIEGRRYIDFGSGIGVLNTGHRHPRIVAAIKAQLDQFTHTAYQIVPYASYVALAERINQLTPGAWPKRTAFFSTGAEAVKTPSRFPGLRPVGPASLPSTAPFMAGLFWDGFDRQGDAL